MSRQIPPHYLATMQRIDPVVPLPIALATALLPLLGVWSMHWPVAAVLGLYWLDNAIIGAFHFLTMLSAHGRLLDPDYEHVLSSNSANTPEQNAVLIENAKKVQHFLLPGFFLMHYGAFCVAHLAVIVFVFDGAFSSMFSLLGVATIVIMVVQHALELQRFRQQPELRALPRSLLMFRPYPRVIALHVALLLGAVPMLFGYPLIAAALLAAIKFAIDRSGAFSVNALLGKRGKIT